jgi:hypothetical protein
MVPFFAIAGLKLMRKISLWRVTLQCSCRACASSSVIAQLSSFICFSVLQFGEAELACLLLYRSCGPDGHQDGAGRPPQRARQLGHQLGRPLQLEDGHMLRRRLRLRLVCLRSYVLMDSGEH